MRWGRGFREKRERQARRVCVVVNVLDVLLGGENNFLLFEKANM